MLSSQFLMQWQGEIPLIPLKGIFKLFPSDGFSLEAKTSGLSFFITLSNVVANLF
jgi:hypothetical protein